jgi:ppGpp synthetase/RelA/SpoT-type nucleotidyltranferase
MKLDKCDFLARHRLAAQDLECCAIDWNALEAIYFDFMDYAATYQTQAEFIASTLRTHPQIHSVKSRIKEPDRLLEKIIRKTPQRQLTRAADFQFTLENYKDEITDLIGIRIIHLFKEDWEEIHNFITTTWHVMEITANVRDGDDTTRFEELAIKLHSRKSGYRSVHYLIEFFPTNQRVIAEIQVRTIFEEGYGEIDHQLRYCHKEIPAILASNLLLFNRIAGSSDEMASFIHLLNKNLIEIQDQYDTVLQKKDAEIKRLSELLQEK